MWQRGAPVSLCRYGRSFLYYHPYAGGMMVSTRFALSLCRCRQRESGHIGNIGTTSAESRV